MYTRQEVYNLINLSLQNLGKDEYHETALINEEIDTLVNLVFSKNRTEDSMRKFVASYIYNHAIYIENESSDLEDSLVRKSILKRYLHHVNLEHIKGEIYYKYDTKPGKMIMYRWHNKNGILPENLSNDLLDFGIHLKSENEADQFFEMLDLIEQYTPKKLKEYMSKQEVEEIVNKINLKDVSTIFDNLEQDFSSAESLDEDQLPY